MACSLLSEVYLSTDDPAIAEVGGKCGLMVPFLRPPEISGDDSPSIDTALHLLDWLTETGRQQPDVLVLLQPTSPLRTAEHITEALRLLESTGADTVVSVVPVPHRYSPYSVMSLEEGRLVDFWKEPLLFDRFRRQSLPTLYARNGPAVLVSRCTVLRERYSFYGETTIPYTMSEADSIDIDTPFDLHVAETALRMRESL